jgi:hypothetical protein
MIKKPKKRIFISFSGGETSAYMMQHILTNYKEHEIVIAFANTGEENEETLIFIKKCEEYFNCKVIWLEYERLSFKVVNFETAYRSHDPIEIENKWQNHPFRKFISHFGIPNEQNKTCTRDLKEYVMNRYLSSIGWKPSTYTKAIGIRIDEIDRLGKLWYPLALLGITKPMINDYWSNMPFRLNLKGYEGNCKTCWKKTFRKLVTIARYNPHWFDFMRQMEIEYGEYISNGIKDRLDKIELPIRFFRENKSVEDIFEMAKDKSILDAIDDSKNTNYQISIWNGIELDTSNGCVESCEVFT